MKGEGKDDLKEEARKAFEEKRKASFEDANRHFAGRTCSLCHEEFDNPYIELHHMNLHGYAPLEVWHGVSLDGAFVNSVSGATVTNAKRYVLEVPVLHTNPVTEATLKGSIMLKLPLTKEQRDFIRTSGAYYGIHAKPGSWESILRPRPADTRE